MRTCEEKMVFERSPRVYEQALLTFRGVDGLDVYNCSIPFRWQGKTCIYGRVERREDWAQSRTVLFERIGPDTYIPVESVDSLPLEDPFICSLQDELIIGGTHVRKQRGAIETYYDYFYRGSAPDHVRYYTTGPDGMKDVRLSALSDGTVAVFSRPRGENIRRKYGSEAVIGFTSIASLDQLDAEVIASAAPIHGLFSEGEWGGCNQVYLLADGRIGVIGHQGFRGRLSNSSSENPNNPPENDIQTVYVNIAFEFNPKDNTVSRKKIIGTRACYPPFSPKRPGLADCAFPSGITLREDGKVNLYSGIGDTAEGRIVIDYPFSQPLYYPGLYKE